MGWKELQELAQLYSNQFALMDKWKKQKEMIDTQIRHVQYDIDRYKNHLAETHQQLKDLNEDSFLNKIRALTGKKNEQLLEKLELAAIRELKLTETQFIKEDLEADLAKITANIEAIDLNDLHYKLNDVHQKMEKWLTKHAPEVAQQLKQNADKQIILSELIREIKEAIDAGNDAIHDLTEAGTALAKAHNLSTWDTFLGGGIYATHSKHEQIRLSNNYIHAAQMSLQRFQNELSNIGKMKQSALEIHVDGFVTFADYFFEDIFSAWSVHTKIMTAREQLVRVLDDVSNTLIMLKNKLSLASEQRKILEKEKEKIYSSREETLFL